MISRVTIGSVSKGQAHEVTKVKAGFYHPGHPLRIWVTTADPKKNVLLELNLEDAKAITRTLLGSVNGHTLRDEEVVRLARMIVAANDREKANPSS